MLFKNIRRGWKIAENESHFSGVARILVRGKHFRWSVSWGEFSKTFKRFLMKIAKNALFQEIFLKKITNRVNFSRVWTKNTTFLEIWRKFRNLSKDFLRKLQKVHYVGIVFKKINEPMSSFFAVWTKNTNFRGILRKL